MVEGVEEGRIRRKMKQRMTVDQQSYDLAEHFLRGEPWFKKLSDDEKGRITMEAANAIQTAIEDFIDAYE